MKWLAPLLLASCITPIARSPYETCAAQGLALEGISAYSGRAGAIATGAGGTVYASGRSEGLSVSCRRPANEIEACEIEGARASLAIKDDYSTWGRNALIGVGYVAFIVPGIALFIGFSVEKSHRQDDAVDAAAHALAMCRAGQVSSR